MASWALLPAILLVVAGPALFVFELPIVGYALIAVSLAAAFLVARALFRDLALIAFGVTVISSVPLNADLSIPHMLQMGVALSAAVVVPYLVARFAYKEHSIRFPMLTGKRWGRREFGYLALVLVLGYLILPFYLISTGVYLNWPDARDPSVFVRLFIGVNAVGIWDELFFVCTVFTLLRRHFPMWQSNLLQAVVFSSFLWEIGYESWGPALTFTFALLQGFTFTLTKSFTYVVTVHLLFDLVLFLTLVHAHNRDWLPIFIY